MNSEAMRLTLRMTKALADIQRVRILMMMGAGELCVCQVIEVLTLAPSTVSKHLSILTAAGLLDSRKAGRWMYYRLPEGSAGEWVRPVLKWLGEMLKNEPVVVQDAKKMKMVVACDPQSLCRRQRRGE
jgi:DNA-binding transcriptional ArsR family regulator